MSVNLLDKRSVKQASCRGKSCLEALLLFHVEKPHVGKHLRQADGSFVSRHRLTVRVDQKAGWCECPLMLPQLLCLEFVQDLNRVLNGSC